MSIRAVAMFMLLILLIAVCVSGCATNSVPSEGFSNFSVWLATSLFLANLVWPKIFWRVSFMIAIAFLCTAIYGCAALPMPLQPQAEQYNSNVAEGGFLVLAAIDTAQTTHIRKGTSCDHEADPMAAVLYGSRYPSKGRVIGTNLALMTVHTMVTSWLDDKVAAHDQLNDGSVGPWYVGRVVWHGVSLLAEGTAVINNHSRGC